MNKEQLSKQKKVKVAAVDSSFVYNGKEYTPGGEPAEMYEFEFKTLTDPNYSTRLNLKLVENSKPVTDGK